MCGGGGGGSYRGACFYYIIRHLTTRPPVFFFCPAGDSAANTAEIQGVLEGAADPFALVADELDALTDNVKQILGSKVRSKQSCVCVARQHGTASTPYHDTHTHHVAHTHGMARHAARHGVHWHTGTRTLPISNSHPPPLLVTRTLPPY